MEFLLLLWEFRWETQPGLGFQTPAHPDLSGSTIGVRSLRGYIRRPELGLVLKK